MFYIVRKVGKGLEVFNAFTNNGKGVKFTKVLEMDYGSYIINGSGYTTYPYDLLHQRKNLHTEFFADTEIFTEYEVINYMLGRKLT